jgi:NADH-quinone oxidoreductase subunit L
VVVPVMTWIQSGSLTIDWALRVDSLTAVMLVVVTTVSSLVHLYSWGCSICGEACPIGRADQWSS